LVQVFSTRILRRSYDLPHIPYLSEPASFCPGVGMASQKAQKTVCLVLFSFHSMSTAMGLHLVSNADTMSTVASSVRGSVTFGYGFAQVQACPGDSVTITWEGYHNIQETSSSDCSSPDIGAQVVGFYSSGYAQTFSNDEIAASPGTTRYFKCDYHCGLTSARFEVSCPADQSSGTGDPHLQNIHGDRFDLMRPGKHVLLHIPRGKQTPNVLLRVEAEVRQLGGQCADMYFQDVNITGAWAATKQTGGFRFQVQDVIDTREWLTFGVVELKVAHGITRQGVRYLNVYVKHLGRVGFAIGGLLGEDDHTEEEMQSEACVSRISLRAPKASPNVPSASSVAVASLE